MAQNEWWKQGTSPVENLSGDDWLSKGATPVAEPKRTRGLIEAANDLVIEGANAAAGGVSSLANMVRPGNRVSSFIDEEFIKMGEEKQSDIARGAKQALSSGIQNADGMLGELGAVGKYVAQNPGLATAQALGSFALPGGFVKGAGKTAQVMGAGAKGIETAGRVGGIGAGAAMAGGDAAGSAYDLATKAGATDEQGVAAGRQASVIPALVGGVTGAFGAEKLLAGGQGFKGGLVSRALKTGASEAGQEAIEEGVTQYEGQRAAMPYDASIDPMKGVAGAAGMGAALGGITGAGISLATGNADSPQARQTVQDPAPIQPEQPEAVTPVEQAPQMGQPLTDTGAGMLGAATDPLRSVVKPSEAMGIDPSAGALSKVAAMAVDSGVTEQVQAEQMAAQVQDAVIKGEKPQADQADPFANVAPTPPPAQVEPVLMEARSLDELRQGLRNAQDPAIRKTIAAEIRKRREAMPDPLTQVTPPQKEVTANGTQADQTIKSKTQGEKARTEREIAELGSGVNGLYSVGPEQSGNEGPRESDFLSNLSGRKSFINKGFDDLNVDEFAVVQRLMLRAAKDDKILNSVVELIPVDVMNMLRSQQLTPEMVFNNPSVLKSSGVGSNANNPVSIPVDAASKIVRAMAGVAAKDLAVNERPHSRGLSVNGGSAGDTFVPTTVSSGFRGVDRPVSMPLFGGGASKGGSTRSVTENVRGTNDLGFVPTNGGAALMAVGGNQNSAPNGGAIIKESKQEESQAPATSTGKLKSATKKAQKDEPAKATKTNKKRSAVRGDDASSVKQSAEPGRGVAESDDGAGRPTQAVDRLYNLVAINEKTGESTQLNKTPMSHNQAVTMKNKMSSRPSRRVQLEDVTNQKPESPAGMAASVDGAVERPDNWRGNAIKAGKVARSLGLDPKGKRLNEIVAEIDANDGKAGKPSDESMVASAIKKADELGLKGADRKQWVVDSLSTAFNMTADEVAEIPSVVSALKSRPSKDSKTKASERFVESVVRQAEQSNVQNTPQGTAGKAAPVEAAAPKGGDAAKAAGVPAKAGASDVQADVVNTSKSAPKPDTPERAQKSAESEQVAKPEQDGWDAFMGVEAKPAKQRKGKITAEQYEANLSSWGNGATKVMSDKADDYGFKSGKAVLLEAFHGTGRGDRVGTKFLKKRATSGPMSFFTSSPDLAAGYATGKQDTSLYNEDNDYVNWFKYQPKGQRSPVPLDRAWYALDAETKQRIIDRMPDIRTDDDGNIIYEEGGGDIGSYQWNLEQTQRGYDKRGNPLAAAIETWLMSGSLLNEEQDFMKVLKLAGFPVSDITYDNPGESFPFVYKTWVRMSKPLVTSQIPADVDAALKEAAAKDRSRAASRGDDSWDKNTRTLKDWVKEYTDTSTGDNKFVWTSIPDKVTDVFQSMGYDGIIDWSGKGGGATHPVYIPFEQNQVKSAIGNSGKFDPAKDDITAFGTKPKQSQGTPADRAVMAMAADGKSADEILNFIASASKSPYRRMLAKKLIASGANPAVSIGGAMGGGQGFRFLAKYSRKDHEVTLSEGASDRAEQIFLHETVHAATLMALDKGGLMATQMKRLYEQVKANGAAEGQYGLKNVGEFVAEAFTNPEFQKSLKGIKVPGGTVWERFVNMIRRVLGLADTQQNALSKALELGADVMRENTAMRKAKSFRAEDGPAFMGVDQTETEALGKKESKANLKSFLDGSKVRKVVYHATRADFNAFDTDKSDLGAHFGNEDQANQVAGGMRLNNAEGTQVMPVWLSIKRPLRLKDVGTFHADGIADQLERKGLLPKGEGKRIIKEIDGDWKLRKKYDPMLRQIIQDAGYDGVVYANTQEGVGDSYIAFRPDQIKSATGNRGTFDPNDPDISHFGVADAVQQIKQFDVKSAPKNTWAHYRGMAMQALGRRQIVDLYSEELPQLGEYDYLVQKMDAEKNETGAEADGLAQAWGNLDERAMVGVGPAKVAAGPAKYPGMEKKLADLMHDATLAQIDPDKPQEAGTSDLQYKALKAKFNALSPKAQDLYRKARDMYMDHYNAVQQAIRERVERSEMSAGQKRQIMAKMDEEFFKKVKGVYFPLARFGQYVIVVKDANGEVKNVTRAETLNEAEAARKELQKAFPAEMGNTVGKVLKQAEFNAGRDAVGKGFMADLMNTLDARGVDDELRDTVAQLYLSSLPDMSWAKHGIHRKGTPGFSQDARRAFAQNMFHGARYLAKLRYADQLQDQLIAMQDHIKDYEGVEEYDSVQSQQVVDEMVKRHEAMMNPKSSPVSTALTSLGFLFHMGLSPASAMVNLTQTALVAYPIMGAKWGFNKSSAALLKASNETVKAGNDLSKVLKGEELEMYKRAVDDGTIDVTMAHDLAGIAQGEDQKVMWKIRPVMRWASFMFHHAEKFNRQATFIAAYRLAKNDPDSVGKTKDQIYEEAKKATYDGHFDYAASNRARILQGNWQKVIFLFKQYGQNMVYTLGRNAYQAIKEIDPKERARSRKALAGMLVMHGAAAGVLGLPLVGPLLTLASFIGSDDDEPWDAELAMQNAMAEMLGKDAAEVIAKGFSRLTPFDISGRVALSSLILPDVQEGLQGKAWADSAMSAALGPVAGIGVNVARGMQKITDGKYMMGFEDMMPSALRGPMKAMRYAMDGAVDKTGVVITPEVNPAGIAGQALGLSPSQVRRDTERRSAIYGVDRALMERRATLTRTYAEAQIRGDTEMANDIRDEIMAFNSKNPNRKITPQNLLASIRNRRRRIQEAKNGVYLPSKRRDALDAVAF